MLPRVSNGHRQRSVACAKNRIVGQAEDGGRVRRAAPERVGESWRYAWPPAKLANPRDGRCICPTSSAFRPRSALVISVLHTMLDLIEDLQRIVEKRAPCRRPFVLIAKPLRSFGLDLRLGESEQRPADCGGRGEPPTERRIR